MSSSSVATDAGKVEQELRQLWRLEAEKSNAGPVLCSRTLNLIVYCRNFADVQRATGLLDPIVSHHPCRAIVVSPAAPQSEEEIHTEVSASCLTSHAGSRYIGRELISLAAQPSAQRRLASIVRALILPDLPVFLWWRDAKLLGSHLFQQLSEIAQRVIVDSAGLEDLQADWPHVQALVQRPRLALSDLAWSRLTSWRQLIAQLFDGPARASYLGQLHRIVVEFANEGSQPKVPADALLLGAWLARQLGFRNPQPVAPADAPAQDAACAWELRNGTARLLVELRHGKRPGTGVAAVFLSCQGNPQAVFVVSRTQDGKGLATRAELPGQPAMRRLVRTGDESATCLVSRELEILGRDVVYEEVLRVASELAPALSPA
ncbi:MAG TPA: glucose-6-phosphate dehydrogenase assembly protein OpcA [Terriglobales bacterium]|nr:glucose-6-phosphate dehydrogenase assembly protein OpcA [Terriglobales bacterium]